MTPTVTSAAEEDLSRLRRPVLVVVDIQVGEIREDGTRPIPHMDDDPERLQRSVALVQAARAADVPVVFIQEAHRPDGVDFGRELDGVEDVHCIEGRPGTEICPELGMTDADYFIRKRRYSCFFGTDFEILMKGLKAETLIFIGGLTDVCVHYSFVDAHQHDYRCRVVEDCVTGSSRRAHDASLNAMEYLQTGARIVSADLLRAWAGDTSRSGFNPHVDAHSWEKLPRLSMTDWFTGQPEDRQRFADALCRAAAQYGFLYIADHGIDPHCIEEVYSASRSFHAQTPAFKSRYHIADSRHHRGYVDQSQTVFEKNGKRYLNFHESFDLSFEMAPDDPRNHEGFGLVGPNVWPDLPGFRTPVQRYYDAVYTLGRELLAAFELGLGLTSGSLLDCVTHPPSQLRLMRYFENAAPAGEQHQGIGAHSDYECFTLLNTAGPGLQLMSADDRWVDAPPQPGTFVLNTGDCLEAWSGGRLKSTQHRVVNLGRERYSLPFFFAADYNTLIEPLAQYATAEARLRYPPYRAGEHLWARTIHGFAYLREKWQSGTLQVPFEIAEENPFKRYSVEERRLTAAD